jgi:mono/diheme cytochrome c family protein
MSQKVFDFTRKEQGITVKIIKIVILFVIVGIIAASTVMYSGIVDVAADEPHGDFVYWLLEETRENSIKAASANIEVPDLSDPDLLLSGGNDYEFMCSTCHLKPGQKESDMSLGLYPAPPNLATLHQEHGSLDDKQQARKYFWVIKHGIKASGMPAWGLTHDDKRIWGMVAFLERLPTLTPDQYQILTAID